MKILHWCVWITADVWYQRWGSCSQGCNNDSVVVTGHHVSAAKKQQTNKHLDHHTSVHGQDDQARTILVYSLIYYSSSLFWETCNSNTLQFMALFILHPHYLRLSSSSAETFRYKSHICWLHPQQLCTVGTESCGAGNTCNQNFTLW